MTTASHRYLTGPGLAALTITPITISLDTLAITEGTATNYRGNFRDVRFQSQVETRNIQTSGDRGANHHITNDDFTLTIAGYVDDKTGVTSALPAPLVALAFANDYFKVTVTKGGAIGVYYCTRGDIEDAISRDEDVETLTLHRLGIGSANPTLASVA